METRKAFKSNWKHIICCLILLVIFVLTIGTHMNAEGRDGEILAESSSSDTVPLRVSARELVAKFRYMGENEAVLAGPKEEVKVSTLDEDAELSTVEIPDIDYYITTYQEDIYFLSKTFRVQYEDVIKDLKKRYESSDFEFEQTNVGYLLTKKGKLKKYKSTLYGLVEYFYDYVESNPRKVNNKRVPYTGGAKYVENLIIYFTTRVYTNVDTVTALSIGASESGYYKVKYMLKSNNVYGGMNSKGLIKYRSIEYGVLSYVRMLSKNYYGKGLTTVSAIGKKYCPTYDDFGNKIASPHWVNLVSTAKKKYKKFNFDIETKDLLSEEELQNL